MPKLPFLRTRRAKRSQLRSFRSRFSPFQLFFTFPTKKVSRTSVAKPDPTLTELWSNLAAAYFPERLDLLEYKIVWSLRRQRRVLASCNMDKKVVRVAKAMDHPRCLEFLEPLLYHEMCHAVVGVKHGKRRIFHGVDFKRLERQHPRITLLDEWIRNGGWLHAVRSYGQRTRKF